MHENSAASDVLKTKFGMNNRIQILALRISLALAVMAGVAMVALTQFELRPQMRKLTRERDDLKTLADQRLARAMKTEAYARELAEQLARTQKQMDASVLENKRLMERNAALVVALEETRAELHSSKQELARWKATGVTPDQLASIAAENKALRASVAILEKDRKKLEQDYATLQRRLDPVDENFTPELPPMKGSVLVVDPKWNFVVLDIGEGAGVKRNGVLMVNRDGKLIGKVRVRRVDSERSIADILPGWSEAEVREGDQVIN